MVLNTAVKVRNKNDNEEEEESRFLIENQTTSFLRYPFHTSSTLMQGMHKTRL
jgi:hypothetical protein